VVSSDKAKLVTWHQYRQQLARMSEEEAYRSVLKEVPATAQTSKAAKEPTAKAAQPPTNSIDTPASTPAAKPTAKPAGKTAQTPKPAMKTGTAKTAASTENKSATKKSGQDSNRSRPEKRKKEHTAKKTELELLGGQLMSDSGSARRALRQTTVILRGQVGLSVCVRVCLYANFIPVLHP
jgi:hypothetical protein